MFLGVFIEPIVFVGVVIESIVFLGVFMESVVFLCFFIEFSAQKEVLPRERALLVQAERGRRAATDARLGLRLAHRALHRGHLGSWWAEAQALQLAQDFARDWRAFNLVLVECSEVRKGEKEGRKKRRSKKRGEGSERSRVRERARRVGRRMKKEKHDFEVFERFLNVDRAFAQHVLRLCLSTSIERAIEYHQNQSNRN